MIEFPKVGISFELAKELLELTAEDINDCLRDHRDDEATMLRHRYAELFRGMQKAEEEAAPLLLAESETAKKIEAELEARNKLNGIDFETKAHKFYSDDN